MEDSSGTKVLTYNYWKAVHTVSACRSYFHTTFPSSLYESAGA